MKLSVISTLYKSASYISEFLARADSSARSLVGDDYEIILVNDGSPDNSVDVAIDLLNEYPRLVVVDLSRNFGHHKAIMAGLEHVSGDLIFLIDCDLEEAPELLLEFYQTMTADAIDVVYGVQKERKGGILEKFGGAIFYSGFNRLSGVQLPRNIVTARLMSKDYVDGLLLHKERDLFLGGVMHITGYRQKALPISKLSKGDTSYTLNKRLALLLSAVTSFSAKPLHFIFLLGIGIFFIAVICAAALVFGTIFHGNYLTGWASLILSIWILGGLTLASVGVVGIYLSKVFVEVKARPNSIVRRIIKFGDSHD